MIRLIAASALGCGLALTVAFALLERRTIQQRAHAWWEGFSA